MLQTHCQPNGGKNGGSIPETLNWYCIHTRPAQELTAAHNLVNQSLTSLAPQFKQRQPHGYGKYVTVIRPLFPRYIFARLDLSHHLRQVRGTRGVREIVSLGQDPVVVEQAIIDEIVARMADGFVHLDNETLCPYHTDQPIRIARGSATGCTGLFKSYLSDKDRVMVLMSLFGRETLIPLTLADIEPVTMLDA